MDKLDTKEIPEKPGIYIFKDKFEEPLYVGKAKNLRKRVPSYFGQGTSWKVKRLVNENNKKIDDQEGSDINKKSEESVSEEE